MDLDKCLKNENIAMKFNSAKFDFDRSNGDEEFEETKDCTDETSIYTDSLLISPFHCFYYLKYNLLFQIRVFCGFCTHTRHPYFLGSHI